MNEPHRSPINPATTGTDSNPGSLNRRHLLALSGSAGAAMALAHSSSAAAATNAMAPFVFVEDFGAAGTGTVNDADAIQAALNSGAHVVYGTQEKVYAIGKALSIPSNVTFDLNYATLRGYTDKIGKLDSDGLHVSMSNVSNARLRRARIIPPLTPFALGGGDFKAAIVAGAGSMHCIVEDCDIDLTGTSVTEGISFQRADYCTAKGNKLTNAGIRYTFSGRCNTVVDNIVFNEAISGAASPAIEPPDTRPRDAYGCVVKNNRVINPPVMGIEDYSNPGTTNLRGTIIEGNTIIGGSTAAFFAISAVSQHTIIANNTIQNWPRDYAIELFEEYGVTCTGNSIFWDDGNPNGCRAIQEQISTHKVGPNIISGNTIFGAQTAILIRGDSYTIIEANSFQACYRALESQDVNSRSVFSNNIIRVTTPSAGPTRTMVSVGTNSIVDGNRVSYEPSAHGGTAREITFAVPYDNCIVANNFVDAHGIAGGGDAPLAVTSNGGTGTNIKILNNIFVGGAKANYQAFTDVFTHGNVCASIIGAGASKMAFFDQQALVAKPTVSGSKGANAALASLLTQLANLGLLTDGTS